MSTASEQSLTSLPLFGIKVLDATSNIAGPFGGTVLADLGAEVVKDGCVFGSMDSGYQS